MPKTPATALGIALGSANPSRMVSLADTPPQLSSRKRSASARKSRRCASESRGLTCLREESSDIANLGWLCPRPPKADHEVVVVREPKP